MGCVLVLLDINAAVLTPDLQSSKHSINLHSRIVQKYMQYFTKTQLVALTPRLYAGEGGGVADKEVSSGHGGEGAA